MTKPYQCRICRNAEGNAAFEVREMMFGTRDQFRYVQCAKCGCLQLAEVPDDLSPYYPKDYYSFASSALGRCGPLKRFLRRKQCEHVVGRGSCLGAVVSAFKRKSRIPHWVFETGIALDDRILDVGCGAGQLLLQLNDLGFTRLAGVDFFIERDLHHGNIVIRKSTLEQIDGVYDLVMFHHSYEHMLEPESTLKAAAQRVSPGKYVIVRVPVAGCHAWRTYGVHWVQLDAPRHIFLHTERSIRILAERAGLVLEKTVYDSSAFQLWGSEHYRRDIAMNSKDWFGRSETSPIFSPEDIARFEQQAVALNAASDGDQACFYLKRI
jgi:SAM-dependent methyltransferase